jgi:hypothetical protein
MTFDDVAVYKGDALAPRGRPVPPGFPGLPGD